MSIKDRPMLMALLSSEKFVDAHAETRQRNGCGQRIHRGVAEAWVLAADFRRSEPPERALAGEVCAGNVQPERLLGVGRIDYGHRQRAAILRPGGGHIQRERGAARVDHRLLASEWLAGLGL